ncbi:N-acetylmuramate alpha-1-phosphate uridylyltransferase [Hyphomicrobiales bacterium]|nr:N-acetylmuramate alpha-1-phosphate uridylyltransferase [Hyphomicrobiales bacterium]CAH1697643.1 N-acetylmuramate alpha-1-phosphate uridylyltransferase [Hyphomicrobiales bacterium]CAI0347290.1 N-acetylmuramate alpha-1-phosphate uridylyltransferase [Hyphomicrobiales bacterium]
MTSTASPPIRRAMVLAAGLGQRMRPITDTLPKPLVRIGGKAMLDHMLDRLADAGVADAVVNVHHLAGQVEAHLAGRNRPRIAISDERAELLETGGGVKKALPLLGAAPFFHVNSDALWRETGRPAMPAMAEAWDPERMDMLLLLADRETSLGFDGAGDFFLGEDGRLSRRGKAASAPWVYAGVAIMKPALFSDTPEGPFSLNLLFDRAIARGRLFGEVLEGRWLHVGTPEAIAPAEAAFAAQPADA